MLPPIIINNLEINDDDEYKTMKGLDLTFYMIIVHKWFSPWLCTMEYNLHLTLLHEIITKSNTSGSLSATIFKICSRSSSDIVGVSFRDSAGLFPVGFSAGVSIISRSRLRLLLPLYTWDSIVDFENTRLSRVRGYQL